MDQPADLHAPDPGLVHEVALRHPDCTTLGRLGLTSLEQAEMLGMVPLGLPLPRGRRDVVIPAAAAEAIRRGVMGLVDRALRRDALLGRARAVLSGRGVSLHPADDRMRVRLRRDAELPWAGFRQPLRFAVARELDPDHYLDLDDSMLADRLAGDTELLDEAHVALSMLARLLREYESEARGATDSWNWDNLASRLWRSARNRPTADDIALRWDKEVRDWRRDRAEARGRAFVDTHFDFARFEQLYPIARGMGRRLKLVIGPTNSGKTHAAIGALKQAASGAYLAPLRLLALEVMERLNAEDTPTSLLTGEEEIAVPGAMHIASTIEMMNPEQPMDVAVIDEVQMLGDPDRGWAWTAALLGVPAAEVWLLGAPESRGMVERIALHLGESLDIIELERKAPLRPLERRVEWDEVEAGDALIAFSRREVHNIRETIQARGLAVAAVYGALAPEVRRREAQRFLSGEAAVVVATDAIGMGLNLPVRRVLFSALDKFDGTAVRALKSGEIRQIAGRAGRYGRFEEGWYGVVGRGTPQALAALLARPDHGLGPATPFAVRPTRAMLARLAAFLGVEELDGLIDCFASAKTAGSPYRVGDLASMRRMATALAAAGINFAAALDLVFMPADLDKPVDRMPLDAILGTVAKQRALPLGHMVPSRIDKLDAEGLEALSRACDLYHWAARKFPLLFPDRQLVGERRAEISEKLADLLASGARRRREAVPKAGFRGAGRRKFGPKRR